MSLPSSSPQSVLLVGGPDAGKTNYLGRLWMALDAENGAITKNGLPAQVEYLRGIAMALNSGKFAPRTAPGVFESTTIPVKWQVSGSTTYGHLEVPDCAGEQWERIHREREWNNEWEQAVASMSGCILFFRGSSEHNVPALDRSNHAEIIRCVTQDAPPARLPTQVVLVDWLQCLSSAYRDIHGTGRPLRVAIVLSAWDMVPKEAKDDGPNEFLSKELPLLHDFLATNTAEFRAKSFGVSIAGGVLSDTESEFMTRYLEGDPEAFGFVVHSENGKLLSSCDLTLPLAWAFGCGCPDPQQPGRAKP